jgi:hypothetical protein
MDYTVTNLATIARLAGRGRGRQLLLDRIRELLWVLSLGLIYGSAIGSLRSRAFGTHIGVLNLSPS